MSINNFPAQIVPYIEQSNFLERAFRDPLLQQLAYRAVADREPVPSRVGETIIKSRPSLKAAVTTPINPANNAPYSGQYTNLDNGLVPVAYTFEQYQLAINQYADSLNLSLEQAGTLLASLFLQNIEINAKQAAQTLDSLCAQYAHKAYDSGYTFANTAAIAGATSLKVDNIIGFDTAFNATAGQSPGLPAAVSGTNTLRILTLNGTTGAVTNSILVSAAVADGTNISSANVGGIAYGASGTLTLTTGLTNAVAIGDIVLAVSSMPNSPTQTTGGNGNVTGQEGAYRIRPNGKLSRYQLTSSDTAQGYLFARAKAKLVARGVSPMSNGLYAAIVDPILMSQLYASSDFQIATQGSFSVAPVFKRGLIAQGWGLEFVESTSVPVYSLPAGGGYVRQGIVLGAGALVEGAFDGALTAARQSREMGLSDIRIVNDILMITRPGIDRFSDVIAQTWKYTGAFVAPTDITSDPTKVPTSDWARYKRAVGVEAYSSV